MSEHPAITRIRPITAPSARPGPIRIEAAPAAGVDHASPEGGVSVAAVLGCLIVGLRIKGASARRA